MFTIDGEKIQVIARRQRPVRSQFSGCEQKEKGTGKKITLLTVLLKVHIIALINAWHQVLQVICLS